MKAIENDQRRVRSSREIGDRDQRDSLNQDGKTPRWKRQRPRRPRFENEPAERE